MIIIRCSGCGKIISHPDDCYELRRAQNYHGSILENRDIDRHQYCIECANEMMDKLIPAGYYKKENV